MADVHVILWWHHHQPWYIDPRTGQARLPWVRLHACRGYLDMAAAAEHPSADNVKHTFNFVPSLLDQMERYSQPGATDQWMQLCEKDPALLTPAEAAELVHRMGHAGPTPVRPLPRLDELRRKVSTQELLTPSEMLDLTVLAHLGFCGATLATREGVVKTLMDKGRGFTLADREALLKETVAVCSEVGRRYRNLLKANRIEITATPYFHPILPLVMDSDVMQQALPDNPRPPRYSFPQDAQHQVESALARCEQVFGARPRGMWPSEGSVSAAAVDLLARNGISFCGTDEMVLRRSSPADASPLDHGEPWLDPSGKVAMFFRDHPISDLIGFSYRFQPPADAAADFLKRAREFGKQRARPGHIPVLTVILDGENPWEHYPNAGRDFLIALQKTIGESGDVRVVSPSDHLRLQPARPRLKSLHAGSWIDGTFAIWIGHAEDRQAWRLLGDCRRAIARAQVEGAPAATVKAALNALYPAQGSDWFWWFGEEFQAREADLYDELFREQIRAAYAAIGVTPPRALDEAIKNVHLRPRPPVGWPLDPELRGDEPSAVGWKNAVRVSGRGGGAMAGSTGLVEEILLGATVEALWMCVRFSGATVPQGSLVVERGGANPARLEVALPDGKADGADTAVKRVLMVCWPLQKAGMMHGETAELSFTFLSPDGTRQRLPDVGAAQVEVPPAFEHWRTAWV